MKLQSKLLAALLLACLAAPASVLAQDAPAAPPANEAAAHDHEATAAVTPAPDPAQRMELIQTLRGRMHEIMQTQDADKRKELLEAQMKDLDALAQMGPPAGMGMGMGMMKGPGAGMMMGQGGMMGAGGMSDCKMGHGKGKMGMGKGAGMGMMGKGPGMGMMMGKKDCMMGDCPRRDGADDARLDALEKRLDMMQMMMQMMMRH